MPGYGTLPADEGTGLLPWSWAEERLLRSHDFWLATVTADSVFALLPEWVFALDSSDFTGSPTRFTFSPQTDGSG